MLRTLVVFHHHFAVFFDAGILGQFRLDGWVNEFQIHVLFFALVAGNKIDHALTEIVAARRVVFGSKHGNVNRLFHLLEHVNAALRQDVAVSLRDVFCHMVLAGQIAQQHHQH